ncbi:nitrogen permease regulator 2-domain-containing protein [Mycena latifolia]|nr:nitrogen permease regulator 2-domain-containing protein [Mycena latifolia]
MPSDGDSFLPRIQSVFYAVFDVRQGPKICYQVPEGLIAVPTPTAPVPTSTPSTPLTEQFAPNQPPGITSRNSSSSLVSPTDARPTSRSLYSPQKRSGSSSRILFNFDDISKYVIPQSQLCGRLVTCSTKRHRIIGFPVELKGKYQRNYLRYNLCFVFERGADLSCYEPIVRKVSRVLTACEEESEFLSSPSTSPAIHAILEQLYEDLNSYSETSIPIDRFNSIELKIFPFYPNPPPVKDWMVPLALINLTKRIEDNWDLTMVKVCQYIDGVNHVSRIAHLADCDLALTRLAISHLLYYQVIMTVDIFQYSNMYTLRKSIQNLAVEADVKEECGPYVTKPGRQIPDWPQLLHLYSRLKPGKTVLDWMEAYGIHDLGIDVRRFTSFGVIKGFLRRVHRWPVLLPSNSDTPPLDPSDPSAISHMRKRVNSLSGSMHFGGYSSSPVAPPMNLSPSQSLLRGRTPQNTPVVPALSPDIASPNPPSPLPTAVTGSTLIPARARRASAAEKVLEQLRNRDIQKTGGSPRTSWIHYTNESEPGIGITATTTTPQDSPIRTGGSESRRQSLNFFPPNPPPSPILAKATIPATLTPSRPRLSRSPSAPMIQTRTNGTDSLSSTPVPKDLLPLLDGEHHTDELAVRFEAGWPLLEQWLLTIGGGEDPGNFGRVAIIYR